MQSVFCILNYTLAQKWDITCKKKQTTTEQLRGSTFPFPLGPDFKSGFEQTEEKSFQSNGSGK